MEAVLLRTGSVPVRSTAPAGSPRPSLSRTGAFGGGSLNILTNRRDHGPSRISRALSESHVFRSVNEIGSGSRTVSAGIPEEYVGDGRDPASFPSIWPEYGIPIEELGISGGGFGRGGGSSGGRGGDGDQSKIGEYYREMLKQNPGDPLLLRNYAKFLHEVERDRMKAEEYYGRAILASPGDGEVLSLFGKLIWETHRDQMRAKLYFDRAAHASPDDCMVMGSYAQFMWEAEEEEDEEEEAEGDMKASGSTAAMVEVF